MSRKTLTSVIAVIGAVLALFTAAGPAQAAATTSVAGWVSTSTSATVGYVFKDAVTVKTGGFSVARSVAVQGRASTSSSWVTLASGNTTSTGAYTASYKVPGKGVWYFRLYVRPTSAAAAKATTARKVTGITGLTTAVSAWNTTAMTSKIPYVISDSVTVKTGTGYRARAVQVQRRPASSTTWTTITSGTTTSTGAYTANYQIPAMGVWYFRLYVPLTATAASGATTARKVTGVTEAVTSITGWETAPITASAGSAIDDAITVTTGTVHVARAVAVQRRACAGNTWSTVTTSTTTSTGDFAATLVAPTDGVWCFRVLVPVTASANEAVTQERTVTFMPNVSWSAQEIPGLGVGNSQATAINGTVVVGWFDSPDGEKHGFAYDVAKPAEGMRDLGISIPSGVSGSLVVGPYSPPPFLGMTWGVYDLSKPEAGWTSISSLDGGVGLSGAMVISGTVVASQGDLGKVATFDLAHPDAGLRSFDNHGYFALPAALSSRFVVGTLSRGRYDYPQGTFVYDLNDPSGTMTTINWSTPQKRPYATAVLGTTVFGYNVVLSPTDGEVPQAFSYEVGNPAAGLQPLGNRAPAAAQGDFLVGQNYALNQPGPAFAYDVTRPWVGITSLPDAAGQLVPGNAAGVWGNVAVGWTSPTPDHSTATVWTRILK